MVSLAQTALMGIAGYVIGNLVTKGGAGGETKGLILGWDPTLALVLAIVITTAIGLDPRRCWRPEASGSTS